MRQAVMIRPGEIELRDVAPPRPGRGEVLLRIRRIGICGSDVHVYHGRHPYTSYPVVQGHEFCATIEELGPGVTSLGVGQKVTALPQIVCGKCPPCRRADYHICDRLQVEGFQAPGVAQELFVTSADRIVVLPEAFTFEQGALVEPLAVAVHAVSRAGDVAGRHAAVLGAGPIGNLVAQVALAGGATVMITDVSDHRLEVARRCGIECTSNASAEGLSAARDRAFGGAGVDVAFECAASASALSDAIETVAKGGTILLVGVFGQQPSVNVGLVQDHELTIRGTLMYRREDYLRAAQAIADGQVLTEPLISRHFPLADYLQAYRYIEESGPESMKVFIDL